MITNVIDAGDRGTIANPKFWVVEKSFLCQKICVQKSTMYDSGLYRVTGNTV